jgi:hypothetical protein
MKQVQLFIADVPHFKFFLKLSNKFFRSFTKKSVYWSAPLRIMLNFDVNTFVSLE